MQVREKKKKRTHFKSDLFYIRFESVLVNLHVKFSHF